jgi:hypothetical protein
MRAPQNAHGAILDKKQVGMAIVTASFVRACVGQNLIIFGTLVQDFEFENDIAVMVHRHAQLTDFAAILTPSVNSVWRIQTCVYRVRMQNTCILGKLIFSTVHSTQRLNVTIGRTSSIFVISWQRIPCPHMHLQIDFDCSSRG